VSSLRALSGVLPVIQTPFDDIDGIDESTLANELRWVLDQGVAGLATGVVSEILRLSDAQRRQLAEVVVGVARDYGALSVISCGAESTDLAVAHARHAERAGADAVMAIAPVSTALDDEGLFSYFAQIAESTSISLVVRDAGGYVGHPLSIEIQVRLFDAYGVRLHFKPEAPPIGQRLSALRDATGGEARIFEAPEARPWSTASDAGSWARCRGRRSVGRSRGCGMPCRPATGRRPTTSAGRWACSSTCRHRSTPLSRSRSTYSSAKGSSGRRRLAGPLALSWTARRARRSGRATAPGCDKGLNVASATTKLRGCAAALKLLQEVLGDDHALDLVGALVDLGELSELSSHSVLSVAARISFLGIRLIPS
jgi:hypothetical protein